jgi:hypothetical protein
MKKLADWLDKKCIKHIGFAKEIGISTSTLHQILKLGRIPTLKIAYAIEIFTQGHITLYDWVDQEQAVIKIAKKTKNTNTKSKK